MGHREVRGVGEQDTHRVSYLRFLTTSMLFMRTSSLLSRVKEHGVPSHYQRRQQRDG